MGPEGCISAVPRFLRFLPRALREEVECRQEGTCGFPRPPRAAHTGGREFTVGAVFPALGGLPTGMVLLGSWKCAPFPIVQ